MTPYCAECGEPFQSQGLFDAHRVGAFNRNEEARLVGDPPHLLGPRRCLTPDEMRAKGWRRDQRTWRGPKSPDDYWGPKREGDLL